MSTKAAVDKKKKTFRWRKLLIVGLALFFCARLGGQINQYFELKAEAEYYQEQLALAEAEYQTQLDKQELYYNEAYLERVARERLGMVKQGESVVSILKTEVPEPASAELNSNPVEEVIE